MKTSLERRHSGKIDRPTAWACFMTNQLVLPGLGSWIAGRWTGLAQMALALAGFILTSLWPIWMIKTVLELREIPDTLGPHFGKAVSGLILFGIAWFWALGSSIAVLQKSPRAK